MCRLQTKKSRGGESNLYPENNRRHNRHPGYSRRGDTFVLSRKIDVALVQGKEGWGEFEKVYG